MTFEKLALEIKVLEVALHDAKTIPALRDVHKKANDLIDQINSAFETGYFTGEFYKLLHFMKSDLCNIRLDGQKKARSFIRTA